VNKQWVKTAPGRRLRHPGTGKVMANKDDGDARPHQVDLDDPHWYRALQRGDLVKVDSPAADGAADPAETATTTGDGSES